MNASREELLSHARQLRSGENPHEIADELERLAEHPQRLRAVIDGWAGDLYSRRYDFEWMEAAEAGDIEAARVLFKAITTHLEDGRRLDDFDPRVVEWFVDVLRRVLALGAESTAAKGESTAARRILLGPSPRHRPKRLPEEGRLTARDVESIQQNIQLCQEAASALDMKGDETDAVTGKPRAVRWRERFRVAIQVAAEEFGVREQRVREAISAEGWDLGRGTLTRDRLQPFVDRYTRKIPT